MSDEDGAEIDRAGPDAGAPHVLDWQALARERLSRLVRVEHDCTVLHDRLDRLRAEHDALLRISDDRVANLHALRTSVEQYDRRVTELAERCSFMEASRSWRITAPLRDFSTRTRRVKYAALAVVRRVIRGTRLGPALARLAPALHARARSRLHP